MPWSESNPAPDRGHFASGQFAFNAGDDYRDAPVADVLLSILHADI